MAKAKVLLPSGGSVVVEGTPDEIEAVVRRLTGVPGRKANLVRAPKNAGGSGPGSVKDYVLELHESGFFAKPRGLTEIKDALAAEGHLVPITTLSGVMLELVKAKALRRDKDKETKNWKYGGR